VHDVTSAPTEVTAPAPASKAEIVIGLATCNHGGTVAKLVRTVQAGLTASFKDVPAQVVIVDAGSSDSTREQIRGVREECPSLVELSVTPGATGATTTGESFALRRLLQFAAEGQARACLVLDASLTSVTPDWIGRLLQPITDHQFDLVAPFPARHKLEGALTSGIVYPLTRALYGKRLRQPLGSVYALSGRLVSHFLSKQVWSIEAEQLATDTRVASEAVCNGFSVCQAFVGPAEHASSGSTLDLSGILAQVLTSVFDEMNRNAGFWQRVRGSEPVRWFGNPVGMHDDSVPVDSARLWESFRLGCRTLNEVWATVLSPAALLAFKYLSREEVSKAVMPDDLWARTIYDFALGYRLHVMNRSHLLRALTPLYLGWLAGFADKMSAVHPHDVERRVQELSAVYENQKPYLISRWRWPDRFTP